MTAPGFPRWLFYVVLAAMFPVAVLGFAGTANEYRAAGIEAVDCDGPLSVLIAAIPALATYAAAGWIFLRRFRRPLAFIPVLVCVVICLALTWNIASAVGEQRKNATEAACAAADRL